MTSDTFQRKLTAILSADVVGYSRLMGDDEEATVRTLNKYRKIIFELVERNKGRVIDSPGDNILTEFVSVVDAVRCGVQIQEDLKGHNDELPSDKKMEFRIGIHTGDVIQDGERIYGYGVNVAARIESLADPGGICVSRTAYDQVKTKIKIDYDYMGEYEVKNIKEPVRVYKIQKEKVSTENTASALSEKPSIAVLPFIDLSPEKDQEYFVDGLSEEILNSLCQISELGVAGRTSSFSFKGSNKTIQEITSILKVSNILEGSVRKAGNKLRITAQLVRAVDGFHLWSKNYDRDLKDIFEIQEDIASKVADELKLTLGIGKTFKQLGGTKNLKAYELYLVAKGQYRKGPSSVIQALETINSVIAIDEGFALAWALKGMIHLFFSHVAPIDRILFEINEGINAAQTAIEIESRLGQAYLLLGSAHTAKGEFIEAEKAYRHGLELVTESIDYFDYELTMHYSTVGYLRKSHELIADIRQNNPLHPMVRAAYMMNLSFFGDVEQTEEEYKHIKALFRDEVPEVDWIIAMLRLWRKDKLSINEIPKIPEEWHGIAEENIWHILTRNIDSAEEGLNEIYRIYNSYENIEMGHYITMASFASYFGDSEFAFNVLEKCARFSFAYLTWIWSPLFRKVRQLPQFKEFIKEIGLVDYWKKIGWPDLCPPVGNDDFVCD